LCKSLTALCAQTQTKKIFESAALQRFQKTNFGVSSAFGAGNSKIGFIMRIVDNKWRSHLLCFAIKGEANKTSCVIAETSMVK
jgi:hypothetical protein